MARRGQLISISGIDGCGKATQAKLLAHFARSEGRGVRLISFPRYNDGFVAPIISRYLAGDAENVDPYLAYLPYALDRAEVREDLLRWLDGGYVVICDRYVPCNMAYQGSKLSGREQDKFFNWCECFEYDMLGLPTPSLQIYLYVDPEVAVANIASRNEGEDSHERNLQFLKDVAKTYERVIERDKENWRDVRCTEGGKMLSVSVIATTVRNSVMVLF